MVCLPSNPCGQPETLLDIKAKQVQAEPKQEGEQNG